MKTFLVSLLILSLGECLVWGSSNTGVIVGLLDRARPVDEETYHLELRRLAALEDSTGMQQYLYSAYWERAPIVSGATPSEAIVGVMRTASDADAEKIFNRGLMFASVGVKGHGKWSTDRKVAEFGYPRILMKFGDVLVSFRDYAPMADSEKLALIAEFENSVEEWRKRRAEVNDPSVVRGPDATLTIPSVIPQDTAPEVVGSPENGVGSASEGKGIAILKAVLGITFLLLAWVAYKRRKKSGNQ